MAPSEVLRSDDLPGWVTRLADTGTVDTARLEEVIASAQKSGAQLEQILVDTGLITAQMPAVLIGMELGVPFVDPKKYDINLNNCTLVPEEIARKHTVFPLFYTSGTITLGMVDPTSLEVVDQVRLRSTHLVETCICTAADIEDLIKKSYIATRAAAPQGKPSREPASPVTAATSVRDSSKIIRLVDQLIEDAVHNGASDIHIEPDRDQMRVRLRVDGVMQELNVYPIADHPAIVSRIKILSKLDISITQKPQDGHFGTLVGTMNVDLRVSTIPTVYGENMVLRLLLTDKELIGLEQLGLPAAQMQRLEEVLHNPHGMILVTGPTGSGKTTTLYAALARINSIERNIITIEDPVEKRVELMRQTQVNTKIGLTFASGLRSILRQDPDVIMVGEIRDKETAEIAVQAALTGHLVLSTLHTNSAAGAIVRLTEMGIQPFLITSSLQVVIAQRLARKICSSCREPYDPDPQLVAALGIDPKAKDVVFYAGRGCSHCLQTGFKGRIGVYEMLEITPELSQQMLSGASRSTIEAAANQALSCTMLSDGADMVRQGLTTPEEIMRIVGIHLTLKTEADTEPAAE